MSSDEEHLLAHRLLRAGCHRYGAPMTAARRVLLAVRVVRGSLRRWQPQTYWQVWMSAARLPLAVLIIGIGLRLVFHTWPTFDVPGSIFAAAYIALVGTRQSLALRRHRRNRELVDAQRSTAGELHR